MKNSRSPISEQYRTIRTNIEYASVDQEMNSIMVTSTGPGEGKSTTVANLAVVFAQQGKKVLLVDADLRKPTVHYTFRVDSTYGLTNLLTKQKSPQQTIQQSQVENLYILPSGPIPPNPAELLGSNAMKELMQFLSQEYDIILFDVPPVLAVTDAQVLANQCNGIILVVQSGGTDVEASKKAKEALLNTRGKLLGAVLNQKKMKKGDYHYYYYENK